MAFSYMYYESDSKIICKLAEVITNIDPDVGYSEWISVLMAIFYETRGSEEGFELADAWSKEGTKYRGERDVRSKWRGLKLDHPRPIRMGTLIRIARQN